MLLIDDRETEVAVGYRLLENRVGADEDVNLPRRQIGQRVGAHLALFPTGQNRHPYWQIPEHRRERRQMLPRQNFGRGEERPLSTALNRRKQGLERDERLSGPDVPLKQTQHG